MFGPKVGGWPEKGCGGCSFVADQISYLDHIHARDITFAMVSAVTALKPSAQHRSGARRAITSPMS
jgi:predicted dithiol-disulfide oxidoreductase (DUF899 family)